MVSIALTGDRPFSKLIDDARRDLARAVREGVAVATDGLKQEIRGQVRAAGLSDRVANAVRGKVYPQGPSARAAGYVYIVGKKGAKPGDEPGGVLGLIKGLNEGSVIRSPNGFFLAIPTAAVPRPRMTPADVSAFYGRPLRFVPGVKGEGRAGKLGLLVMENVTASRSGDGFRNATPRRLKSGRHVASAVMFILVPSVRMPKRLDLDGAAQRWGARMVECISAAAGG